MTKNQKIVAIAIAAVVVIFALLWTTSVHAWYHCGTPQAESDCPSSTPKPSTTPTPTPTPCKKWNYGQWVPCATATPSPTATPSTTPSPTPTPTPSSTPNPCIQLNALALVAENPCETPSPTPSETPIPSTPPEEHHDSSPPGAPVCTDGTILQLPIYPHVIRAGDKATVQWWQTAGDGANVYYKEVNEDHWTHSVSDIAATPGQFVSVPIGSLNPSFGYTFGIEQKHGCGGGQTVQAVIVDGPLSQLFQFSYWQWGQ